MFGNRELGLLRLYILLLAAGAAAVLAYSLESLSFDNAWSWGVLVGLFFAAEYSDVYFHHKNARYGLSVSEAILFPLVMSFSFAQVVVGVASAIAIERAVRRVGWMKFIFNVAQFTLAAAAAAAVHRALGNGIDRFSPRHAVAGAVAVVIFAASTHVFTSIAVSIAERRSFMKLSKDVGAVSFINLLASLALGSLFSAAFFAADWIVALFPLFLVGLYFGYRAVLRQSRERERVEHLYAAGRALASSPDLSGGLTGFLASVADMASAGEASIALQVGDRLRWWRMKDHELVEEDHPEDDPALSLLLTRFRTDREPLVARSDESEAALLLHELDVNSLMAVPLIDDEGIVGCLVAADRLGADEFEEADARLLQALANELVVTLGSYRLFAEVVEERERFRRIFEGSKEGIFLLDEEGTVLAWNSALESITGYRSDEMVGRRWSDRLTLRASDERRLEGLDLTSVASDEVFEVVTRDGPSRWVALVSGPVGVSQDKGWVVLVRDVTTEHELEEAKSDFLSTISHELRTPLTAIKGSLQVLSRGPAELPEEVHDQMLGVLQRGSDRLERLVLNLLFVSQLETDGTPHVVAGDVDLRALLEERLSSHLGDAPVNLDLEDDVIVRADRERAGQAIEQLLDNARKFGGETPITVTLHRRAGYAELTVSDQGPGIPKADQERIFERFVRLGHVLRRETQGPGVGLFIVRESVKAMGGEVSVESEPGHGATFRIRLPLARPIEVASQA